jgi:NAD(P)-dependent dehydrogenase (short-subunit alcohol dehydrogenase family)
MPHPALTQGRVAVITGAASGIGRAAAERFAEIGMKLVLADANTAALEAAASDLARRQAQVITVPTDVSRLEDVERLKQRAYAAFGEVAVLMNNAGREGGGQWFGSSERWRDIIGTNLWGVVHGVNVFGPAMMAQGTPGAIINTGSKQGITCPPGDTAYNVSKAGIKVVTEALAHDLRNIADCQLTAHLLVPGFTFTGFTRARVAEKPPAAWLPEQVIDCLLDGMANGDFYIICPDNEVTREVDNKRILWAAQDITENRPPLSRWHPDHKAAFAAYMAK